MLSSLPAYIPLVFILTVILTLFFLLRASFNMTAVIVPVVWLAVQGVLSYSGFYADSNGRLAKLAFVLVPPLILIILILATRRGKRFTRRLDLRTLHLLHVIRIPVEVCLYWLSLQKTVPELMTFAGDNFDIVMGITAPILFLTCFKRRAVRSVNLLFGWNIIGLVMLSSAVVKNILSIPTVFQKLAFDQPNIAVLYFPFIWLLCFILPVVLFSHLVMIKRLMEN
jgi:hypothetical protein